jgi:hypothetical protein
MLPTLIFGVVIGVKFAIVLSLWLAGVAQWWLARILNLGKPARIWSAFMAVVGGHLAGKLDVGAFGLVISTATSSLALVAALELGVTGKRRSSLVLAIAGALVIVSGQGYLQLALLSWAPAILLLLLNKNYRLRPIWREYLLALVIGILLTGIFIIPVAHFWPNLTKFTDDVFASAQPFEYGPINLIIRDYDFLRSDLLGKLPFPYLYITYIGWVPILFALASLLFVRGSKNPLFSSLFLGLFLMFFVASAIPLRWLVKVFPQLSGFRHPALVANLTIPIILALGAYGLDKLLSLNWPQLIIKSRAELLEKALSLNLAWILVIPLYFGVKSAYDFGQMFLKTDDLSDVYEIIGTLKTSDLQWVSTPYGEHFWVEPALEAGMKVAPVVWAWNWESREHPQTTIIATRGEAPPNANLVGSLNGISIYRFTNQTYAFIDTGAQKIPCFATGNGGDLTVKCSSNTSGKVLVQENSSNGWLAWRDGERVLLQDSQWLSVDAPAGQHEYRFRYLPIDVLIGMILTITGFAITIWLWRRSSPTSLVDIRTNAGFERNEGKKDQDLEPL